MVKSTIVVAFLAASVASASAAPSSSQNHRSGTSFQSRSNQQAAQVQPARPLGAAAFTSARNAGLASSQPAPQAMRAAVPTPPTASRAGVRSARTAEARTARRQTTSARNFRSRSSAVALNRDVPIERMTRPAERAAAAPKRSIQSMVTAEAQRAGVAPSLGHAVVKVESMYNPRATGKGGYIGLMQLSYQTAKGMGYRGSRAGLYEPSTNLRYGMRYLAQANAKAGGSTCGAVSKYQGGHAVKGVTRAGAVYCGKVRRYMASR